MKRFRRILFETWYGACIVWLALGAVTLVFCGLIGPCRRLAILVNGILFVHALIGVVMPAAVVFSLVKRRWGCALGQFLLMIVATAGYLAAFAVVSVALMFSDRNMKDFERTERPWYGTEANETLPFAVEFRAAHPFLAEYDRRIVFKSGKSVDLTPDTGGAGDFAVYALKDGSYYLMDCLDRDELRSEYLVNTKAETVGRIGVAAEGLLKDKRYIGRVTTSGEFVRGESK